MVDAFGNCQWCGKRTNSSGGCPECNGFMVFVPETWTTDGSGGYVHDSGWHGPMRFLPAKYRPLLSPDVVAS